MTPEETAPSAPPPPTEAMMAALREAQPRWKQETRAVIPIRSPHLAEAGEVTRRVWEGQVAEIGVSGGGGSDAGGDVRNYRTVRAFVMDGTTPTLTTLSVVLSRSGDILSE